MLLVEKDYQSLSEEVEEQRKLMKLLRNKYKDAIDEITDLGKEHFQEKEVLLESLREMEQEMELYKSICNMAFNHDEIEKISTRARYDSDQRQWIVPQFMFRGTSQLQFVKEKAD